MSDIIGMKFKRNKYGLSIWEDTVQEVIYEKEIVIKSGKTVPHDISIFERLKLLKEHKIGLKLVPKVIGINTIKAYTFDEIVFL